MKFSQDNVWQSASLPPRGRWHNAWYLFFRNRMAWYRWRSVNCKDERHCDGWGQANVSSLSQMIPSKTHSKTRGNGKHDLIIWQSAFGQARLPSSVTAPHQSQLKQRLFWCRDTFPSGEGFHAALNFYHQKKTKVTFSTRSNGGFYNHRFRL